MNKPAPRSGHSTPKIRTMLVDDVGAVRRSLRALLETTPDIRVVGEAAGGIEAITVARALQPDVILMDLRMPDGDGLDAIEALSGMGVENPIPILVFTTFHLDEYLYGAFERGAVGYLLKKNPGDIPAAIRSAVNANALQSPAVRERMIAEFARGSNKARRTRTGASETDAEEGTGGLTGGVAATLTDRELDVVTALSSGLSNKQIALRLNLGENTVKWHIGNMLEKTGAADRTQLALWAVRGGLNPEAP